jgi:hypothetical protein
MTTSILIDSRTPICQEAKPCRLFHFHWKEIKCFVPTLSEFVRVVTDIGIDLLRRKIMSPRDVFILLPSSSAMSMGLYAWTFPQFNSHVSYHFTYQNSQVPRSMNTLWSPSRNLLRVLQPLIQIPRVLFSLFWDFTVCLTDFKYERPKLSKGP